MTLNSDINLAHPLWERADNELCSKDGIGLFNRLVDIYILACSIGIKEDKVVTEFDNPLNPTKSIGRNTYLSMINEDLKKLLDFMLQNAIINTQTIDLDIDERLKLAFDPDYTIAKLSPANFLTGFANYGIEQIFSHIDSTSSIVAIDELYQYFSSLEESKYDDILASITLSDIKAE